MNALANQFSVLLILIFTTPISYAQATRFAPVALQQDGKITLTPSFTPNGNTIYFAQSECSPIWKCPQRLKKSERTATGWTKPELVPLPTDARVDWPAVSPDGETLVFSWAAPRSDYKNLEILENFDLYTLDLNDANAVPRPIYGSDINRPRAGSFKTLRYVHNEGYPSLTSNGDLYFMTERLDGIGERDIYMAPANQNGVLQTAFPLSGPINSPQRDDGVWVNADGTLMLLTYGNRGGEGSADIFVSSLVEGEWQTPINLGKTINSPYADFGAKLNPAGTHVYFTSDRPVEGEPEAILQVWEAPFDKTFYLK
ncbi:PD40 domain-containing protein [Glaciecola sp. XM2]|jgi:Tol biopolymer transport system component|uniref:PD40 domain-containing protein n=1 Tax=Glaciecola sp. XM2 TaxID=1914931 RepID=UPI001BDE4B69|nr:PD40 domain-containing protein [Glaciecola sp. XM2]MBT1449657.1 PD40 domain-containing protein [Glaciecola sp. XM2]